jgi:diaminohydroxyphosphoribosylaminopyrimidine deaminase/5-amino-6-(5-phosphoribosylamino)uracil reductase
VQTLRARSDAILIGIGTAIAADPLLTARVKGNSRLHTPPDDPLLTARVEGDSRLHTRIVLDSHLRLPPTSQLARTTDELPVDLYFTREGFVQAAPEQIKALMKSGVTLRESPADLTGRLALPALIQSDKLADVTHLLVEPGPTLATSFFNAGAADRLWVIESPRPVNDPTAPAATSIPSRYIKTGELKIDDDVLTEYLDPESDLFFAAEPSADWVLATKPPEFSVRHRSASL